jgi:hypothetical protein
LAKEAQSIAKKYLGRVNVDERCVLVTCGDNNGAMNYFLRELGGQWSWVDLEDTCLEEMPVLLDEPVIQAPDEKLPFADASFDRVISIVGK